MIYSLIGEGDIIPVIILLYFLAARYTFGNNQLSDTVSKLSVATKGLAADMISDPHKLEKMISVVRTAAPLTSPKTVSRINTFLPSVEKVSTLMGMYSFLNKAQNFSPVVSLSAKTPMEKVGALIKSNNIPITKMMAQPLLKNNMEKIMSNAMKDMVKNGNINEMMSSFAKQYSAKPSKNEGDSNSEGSFDLNGLLETFMPMLNSLGKSDSEKHVQKESKYDESFEFKSASILPEEYESDEGKNHKGQIDIKDEPEEITDVRHVQRNLHKGETPVRIRQRKRRH
jgi:hypothetical protein